MGRNIPDCLNPAPGQPWRRPLDEQDVAVRLEVDGITDSIAQSGWGYSSTWDVARDCAHRITAVEESNASGAPLSELRMHLTGMSFALPLALCCLAMIFLKLSLWGGDLASDVASAVAIGTVSSFVITGGIVQAMARQGLFYAGTGELRMAEIVCRRWLFYGVSLLLGAAAAASIHFMFFGLLPHPLDWIALGFHFTLGLFWLSSGVLYMLERHLFVAVAASVGIVVVAGLHIGLGVGLVRSQLVGIFIAAIFAGGIASHLLKRRGSSETGRVHRIMPWRTLYLTAPYLAYGCLYYLFLFADRILAWTAQTESTALPLVFRGDYELPLDIALFAFVVQVGWVHSSMFRFYERLESLQRSCEIAEFGRFNKAMQEFYIRRVTRFIPATLLLSAIIWRVAEAAGLLSGPITSRVAIIALAGYPFLVIALWNVSLLFALSLPRAVLPAVVLGTVANAVTGYVLSRLVSYDWAVVGFTAGAIVFGFVSSSAVLRRFRNLDYHYFASAA